MFVPSHYRLADDTATLDVIARNPLAMLVNNGPDRPWITHLPALLRPDVVPGRAADAVLVGHMNRANPHHAALVDGAPATLVFNGPNGYISPTTYDIPVAAPTWDFVTVHVHGTIRLLDDPDETVRVICWTVEAMEQLHGTGWDRRGSMDYFRKILPGVAAFEFQVTSAEGMFKLSQELEAPVRDRVVKAFESSPYRPHADLSALIARVDSE